jgi:hypothetical protein
MNKSLMVTKNKHLPFTNLFLRNREGFFALASSGTLCFCLSKMKFNNYIKPRFECYLLHLSFEVIRCEDSRNPRAV